MSDLIDRNEVIEIIESVCSADDTYWQPGMLEKIRNLPTHSTPSNTLDISVCVDRQAVKEWLERWEGYLDADMIARMQYKVIDIPSVQPRKGKWHGKGDSEGFGIFICDNCGKFAMMEYDFCPNCGSRMGGEQTG